MSFQPLVSRWYLAMAEHDRGRLVGRVVVGGDRVVDEGHLHHAVVGRRARRHRVGAPRRARDDRRRRPGLGAACCLGLAAARATRRPAGRGGDGDEVHAQRAAQRPRGAQLQLVAAPGPDRIGGPLAGAGVGRVVAVDGERHPRAPASRRAGARAPRSARAPRRGRARRAASKRRGARSTRLVAPSKSPGTTAMPKPRARAGAPLPRALNGRTSSDPRPAAAPRTRARRRVIVVPPTAARVARRAEGATPARSPATRLGLASAARVAVALEAACARRRRRRARGPSPARWRTRRPASARRRCACPR